MLGSTSSLVPSLLHVLGLRLRKLPSNVHLSKHYERHVVLRTFSSKLNSVKDFKARLQQAHTRGQGLSHPLIVFPDHQQLQTARVYPLRG